MKRTRAEYRLFVKRADGTEYGGRIVYRRTTAAQRLLDYAKDGLEARYEVWSNENPAGEWQHLSSQDRPNVLLESQVKPKPPAPWGQTSGSIVTRRGKKMSKKQYVALVRAQNARGWDTSNACVHGHLSCAAWYKGPCSAELTDGQEDA